MTGEPLHYAEELQDLLDGRLAEPQRAEVEAHLAWCDRCRREMAALAWSKDELSVGREATPEPAAPADLHRRLRAALDAEDRRAQPARWTRRAWLGTALGVAAATVVIVRARRTAPLPDRVADDFRAYADGTARLAIESADSKAVEAYFAANGATFPTRVLDLAMMRYQVVGGRVHQLNGRVSALFAYRGPDNVALVCQMYEGTLAELPAAADVRVHNDLTFHVYRSGNVTIVFWPEGDVICVLASTIPPDAVVQLAFAKAMKPGPATS